MSCILYYSNYCDNCKNIIRIITKNNKTGDMHFISIDKREKHKDGSTKIILENGQRILMPPVITSVPSLLLLNNNHKVIKGKDILEHLELSNRQNVSQMKNVSQQEERIEEPSAFSFPIMNDVASDNFSFLDQGVDELSAEGTGGLRQLYHYSTINNTQTIQTPEETYKQDTIGNAGVSLEKIESTRNEMFNR